MNNNNYRVLRAMMHMNNRYIKRWLYILCCNEEYYRTFVDIYLDVTDLEASIFEFQSHLKHIGRGQHITIEQIYNSIKTRNRAELKALLEELFLIPVENKELSKVMKIKDREGLEDFLHHIKRYSSMRYARVIEEYFYYNEAG